MSTNSSPETLPEKITSNGVLHLRTLIVFFFSYPTNIHVEGPSISKLLRGI